MSKKRRKRYTREFKDEAVRLLNESERPLAEIAAELEVSKSALWRWAEQAGDRAGQPPREVVTGLAPEQEIRLLKRELDKARQERDFLKKAVAFFAKDSDDGSS